MPPNYNNQLNPQRIPSRSIWTSITHIVDRVIKFIFRYVVLPWLIAHLGFGWLFQFIIFASSIFFRIISFFYNPLKLFHKLKDHLKESNNSLDVETLKSSVGSAKSPISDSLFDKFHEGNKKYVGRAEQQLLFQGNLHGSNTIFQIFHLYYYRIMGYYLSFNNFLNQILLIIHDRFEEVSYLTEKADYILDRYIKHSPFCVLNKIYPQGKKSKYHFNGIPISKYEGFKDYVNYRKNAEQSIKDKETDVDQSQNVLLTRLEEQDKTQPSLPNVSTENSDMVNLRVPTPYPILSEDQKEQAQANLPSSRKPILQSKQTQTISSFATSTPLPESLNIINSNKQESFSHTKKYTRSNGFNKFEPAVTIQKPLHLKNSVSEGKVNYINIQLGNKQRSNIRLKIIPKNEHKNKIEVVGPSLLGPTKTITHSISPNDTEYVEQVKAAIRKTFPKPNYDDGSLAPIILRLAWHCAATFDKATGNGGSNGATMRFLPEITDEGNTGLEIARAALEPIKQSFPKITYSDLWTLAGKVAIEEMGGPEIPWKGGRVDCRDDKYVPPNGRLPFAYKDANHIRETFSRMGINDQEAVILLGAHGLGRCHKRFSGWEGKWTPNSTKFSNDFFKVLMNEKWSVGFVPETGREQYYNEDKSLMMLNTDLELIRDPVFYQWVKLYSEDEKRYFQDFAVTFGKLLELGIDRDEQGNVLAKKELM